MKLPATMFDGDEDAYLVEQALLDRPVTVRRLPSNEILFCCKRAVVVATNRVLFVNADADRVKTEEELGTVVIGRAFVDVRASTKHDVTCRVFGITNVWGVRSRKNFLFDLGAG